MRQFITARETAHILGLSTPRIYQLVRAGKLRVQKIGRTFVFESQEVLAFRLRDRPKGRPGHAETSPRLRPSIAPLSVAVSSTMQPGSVEMQWAREAAIIAADDTGLFKAWA